ncbi:MAG: DUF523 domain-containing protein [Candidatus Dadabacteria bacterium]|nr:MAG: DUF523 domain-containing protein [Candidatus Dadabacteria bacterium]
MSAMMSAMSETTEQPIPRVVTSRCLESEPVRYDGTGVAVPGLRWLLRYVERVTVCPEIAVGLGVPRPPIRLLREDGELVVRDTVSGRRVDEALRDYATSFAAGAATVDGFILKAGSPSCGLGSAKIWRALDGDDWDGRGDGVFAEQLQRMRPDRLFVDECALTTVDGCLVVLARLRALARIRQVERGRADAASLRPLAALTDIDPASLDANDLRERVMMAQGPVRAGEGLLADIDGAASDELAQMIEEVADA